MAKYKVNLDPVWNLPIATGYWHKADPDGYCAFGLIAASLFGAGNVVTGNVHTRDMKQLYLDLMDIGICPSLPTKFDCEIHNCEDNLLRPGTTKELVREKYVRIILERGLETGLFELSDSDLDVVRELKSVQLSKSDNKESTGDKEVVNV